MSKKKRSRDTHLEKHESAGKRVNSRGFYVNDPYARITVSLLTSSAFQSLSNRQKLLLINMKTQRYGSHPPRLDFKEDEPHWRLVNDNSVFYYPRSLARIRMPEYSQNSGRLYEDIKALEKTGFIDIIVHSKSVQSKNIYKFSDRWWRGQNQNGSVI